MKYLLSILFLLLLYSSSYSQGGILDGIPKIAYWEYGNSGPITIIINGGPGYDHTYLQPEWDTLSSISRIVYYDQRGCGESDNSNNYTWIEHIKDLKRLKDHISSGKRVILAASSWGTNLALIYSIYFPRDISGLILSGFTDWRGINSKKIDLYNYQIDSIINFKRAVPISYMSDSILKSIMSPSRYSVSNTTKPEMMNPDFSKRFHRKSSEAYQLTFNSLPSMPDLTFFPEIQVPALIIRGNLNCGYPDWSDIISKKITGSELYTIINTCHDPWYSNPELFFSKCFDFIKLINH